VATGLVATEEADSPEAWHIPIKVLFWQYEQAAMI